MVSFYRFHPSSTSLLNFRYADLPDVRRVAILELIGAHRLVPLEAEELIKSLRHQPQSQLTVSGPKQAINMQRECHERSVFRVYVGAQPSTLHPGADRNHTLVHEC